MAIIIPYLDPNAHGKLNNSLCFRRHRDTVILQGLPVPKKTSTIKQIEQRQKMIDSRNDYKLLPFETLNYLRTRATRERMTSMNIYSRSHMTDQMPSEVPVIPMKKIIKMVLLNPVGVVPEHIKFTLINQGTDFDCELWSKLNERVGDEVPSEIGPNGAVTGDLQFSPVQFEDGVCYKIPSGGPNQDFVSYGLMPLLNEGLLEFWLKLMFPIVNGKPVPPDAFMIIAPSGSAVRNYISLQFHGGVGTRFGYSPDDSYHYVNNIDINLDAESVHHYILGWSKSGKLPGDKTMALFLDGIEVTNTDESLGDNTQGINLQLLRRFYVDTEGYGDNLKVYPSVEYLQGVIDNRIYEGFATTKNYGYIYDNNNQFVFENEVTPQGSQILRVQLINPEPVKIPFRYPISVEWEDNNFMTHTSIIRLPEMMLEPGGDVDFYLSTDFSAYWDPALWRLAGTDIM